MNALKTLKAFIDDKSAVFALRKVHDKNPNTSMVYKGYTVIGKRASVNEYKDGKFGVSVIDDQMIDGIHTSPVKRIVSETSDAVEFETQGGIYLLVKSYP